MSNIRWSRSVVVAVIFALVALFVGSAQAAPKPTVVITARTAISRVIHVDGRDIVNQGEQLTLRMQPNLSCNIAVWKPWMENGAIKTQGEVYNCSAPASGQMHLQLQAQNVFNQHYDLANGYATMSGTQRYMTLTCAYHSGYIFANFYWGGAVVTISAIL